MNAKAPDPIFVLRGSHDPITSICFEDNLQFTNILATGNQAGLVALWNLEVRFHTYLCC